MDSENQVEQLQNDRYTAFSTVINEIKGFPDERSATDIFQNAIHSTPLLFRGFVIDELYTHIKENRRFPMEVETPIPSTIENLVESIVTQEEESGDTQIDQLWNEYQQSLNEWYYFEHFHILRENSRIIRDTTKGYQMEWQAISIQQEEENNLDNTGNLIQDVRLCIEKDSALKNEITKKGLKSSNISWLNDSDDDSPSLIKSSMNYNDGTSDEHSLLIERLKNATNLFNSIDALKKIHPNIIAKAFKEKAVLSLKEKESVDNRIHSYHEYEKLAQEMGNYIEYSTVQYSTVQTMVRCE